MTYLPYYFGSYICVICGISFDTEFKLLKHILKEQHTETNDENFTVKTKRKEYFEKKENRHFGVKHVAFGDDDITYLIKSKAVTNFDRVDEVLAILKPETCTSDSKSNKTDMELNKFSAPQQFGYDSVTPINVTTPFEDNVLKQSIDTCTLPSPPSGTGSKRKADFAISRHVSSDVTVEILDQRLKNLEIKVDNLEIKFKTEIQSAKEDILAKLDQAMNYDRHLFHAVTTQFRETLLDLLSKSSQASYLTLTSMSMQSSSDR